MTLHPGRGVRGVQRNAPFPADLTEAIWPAAITERDIAGFPEPVTRYLRFMEVVGRPSDTSFMMRWKGRFRRTPEGPWASCDIWQYNTGPEIARYFSLHLHLYPMCTITAHDTYVHGRGHMEGRVLEQFTVLEAQGLELDIGELVTWLDDAILFAPSMLLRPSVTWAMAGADAFDITLSDAGRTVQARVTIDDRGAPTDVSTTDRFVEDPYRPGRPWVRARWTTPVVGWVREGGRLRPSGVRAVWHLEKGEFPYVVADTGAAHVLYEPPRELVDAEMKRERLA